MTCRQGRDYVVPRLVIRTPRRPEDLDGSVDGSARDATSRAQGGARQELGLQPAESDAHRIAFDDVSTAEISTRSPRRNPLVYLCSTGGGGRRGAVQEA